MGFGVVGSLLNDISAAQKKNNMQVVWIPRNRIVKNGRNGYGIHDIGELEADIRATGVAQPLEVLRQEDGNYRLLTGERRLTAIDRLIECGDWTSDIPCIIRSLEDYDLPLTDESKEMYAILRTNMFNRNLTDEDLVFQAAEWTGIVQELKANGYEKLGLGKDSNGKEVELGLTGRTRENVARILNVSNGQMAKVEYIRKNASEGVKTAVGEGRMKISAAYKAAQMGQGDQEELVRKHPGGAIDSRMVLDFQNNKISPENTTRKMDKQSQADSFPLLFLKEILEEEERELASLEAGESRMEPAGKAIRRKQAITAGLRMLIESQTEKETRS